MHACDTMNSKSTSLSRRYAAALREHLKRGPRAGAAPAADLGRQAVVGGLGTLDLVRIHERAMAQLLLASGPGKISVRVIKRAAGFFAKVIIPIEQTHRDALTANDQVKQLSKTLGRRTVDLAASQRDLKQGITRRKTADQALQQSGQRHARLLAESRRLQTHLRHLTRQHLSAQEDERKKISRELHNEIAQALLGINVRLLTLKARATASSQGLQKEIASTERLVANSINTLKRFAREFGNNHEP